MRWLIVGLLLSILGLASGAETQLDYLRGAAVVLPAHGDRWQAAQLGQVLRSGDRLRVIEAPGHHARLSLAQARHLHVGPGAVIEIIADAEHGIRLRRGQLGLHQAQDLSVALGDEGPAQPWSGSLVLDAKDGRLADDKIPDWLRGLAMADARHSGLSLLGAGSDGSRHLVQPADVDVEVRIVDGLAHCSLEVGFQQHRRGLHETELLLPLPALSAVDGFALYQHWSGWQQASVIERQRGRAIWRELVEARIDPALLEWEAGNIFRMRVFPVHRSTRMRVQWIEPLHDQGDGNAHWRLALGDLIPSDALLPQLRIRVLIPDQQEAAVIGGGFDPRLTRVDAGMEILDTAQALQHPLADWQLQLASSPQWLREDSAEGVVLRQRAEAPALPKQVSIEPLRLLIVVDRSAPSLHGEELQLPIIEALCELLPPGSQLRLAQAHLEFEALDDDWWDPQDLLTRHGMLYQLQQTLPLGAAHHPSTWAGAAALDADVVLYLGSGQESFHSQALPAHDYGGRWLALGLGPRVNAGGLAQWGRDGALRTPTLDDLPQALARLEALLAGAGAQPLLPEVDGIDASAWLAAEDGAGNTLWFARLASDHPSVAALDDIPRAQGAGLLSRAQLQAEVVHLSRQQPSPEGQARLRHLGDAHGLLTPLHALLVLDSDAMRARFDIEAVLPPSSGSGDRDVADGKLLAQLQEQAHRQAIDQVGALRHAARVHLGVGMRQVWPPDADHRLEGRGAILGFSSPRGFDLFGNGGSGEPFAPERSQVEVPATLNHPLGENAEAAGDGDSLSSLLASPLWIHPQTALEELSWEWRLLLDPSRIHTSQYWPLEPALWNLDSIAPPFFDTSLTPQQRIGSPLRQGTFASQGQQRWRARYERADGQAKVELLVEGSHWLLRWEDEGRRFARWHHQQSEGVVDVDAGIASHTLSPLHNPGLPMLPGASAPTLQALANRQHGQGVITYDADDDGWHLRWWEDHYLRHEAWLSVDADGSWRCQRERSHHPDGSHSDSTWTWDTTPLGTVPVAIEHQGYRWALHWESSTDGELEQALGQVLAGTLSLPGAQIQALPVIAQERPDPQLLSDLAEAIAENQESAAILEQIGELAPRLHPLFLAGWAQAAQGRSALDDWLEQQAEAADSPFAREFIGHWRRHRGWRPEPSPRPEPPLRAWPSLDTAVATPEWEAAIQRHQATYGTLGAAKRLCAIIPATRRGAQVADIALRLWYDGKSDDDTAAIAYLLRWMLGEGEILISASILPLVMEDVELLALLHQRLASNDDLAWRQAGAWGNIPSDYGMRLNAFHQRILNGADQLLVRAWQQGARRGDRASWRSLLIGYPQALSDIPPHGDGAIIPQAAALNALATNVHGSELDHQRISTWLTSFNNPLAHLQNLDPLPQWSHGDLQQLLQNSSTLVLYQFSADHRQQREETLVALWQRWAEALPPTLGPYLRLAAAEIQGRYDVPAAIATIHPLTASDDPALALTALYSWAAVDPSDAALRAMVDRRSQQPSAWHERRLQLLLALANDDEPQAILQRLAAPQIEGPLWGAISAFLHAANADYQAALDQLSRIRERYLPQTSLLRARLLQALAQPLDLAALHMLRGLGEFDLFAEGLNAPSPGIQAAELAHSLAAGEFVQALRLITTIENHLPPADWQRALRRYAASAFGPQAQTRRAWQHPGRALHRAWQGMAHLPLAEDLRAYWQQRAPEDYSPRATVWLDLVLQPPQDPQAVFALLQALAAVGDTQALGWLELLPPPIDGGAVPADFLQQPDQLKAWSIALAPRSWLETAVGPWIRGTQDPQQYQDLLTALERRASDPAAAPWVLDLLAEFPASEMDELRQRLRMLIRLADMLNGDPSLSELAALLPAIVAASSYGAQRLLLRYLRDLNDGAWENTAGAEILILAAQEHAAKWPTLQLALWRACGANEVIIHHHLTERSQVVERAWTQASPAARERAAQQLAEELWRLAPRLRFGGNSRIPLPNRAAESMVFDRFAQLGRAAIPQLSDQQRHQVLDFLNSHPRLRRSPLRQDLLSAMAESAVWPHRQAQWDYLDQILSSNPKQAAIWYRQYGADLSPSGMSLNDVLRLSFALHNLGATEHAEELWQDWCTILAQGQAMAAGDIRVTDDLAAVLAQQGWLEPLLKAMEQRLDRQRDLGSAHDPWAGFEALASRPRHGQQGLMQALATLAQAAGRETLALRCLIDLAHPVSFEQMADMLVAVGSAKGLLAAMDAQGMGLPTLRARIADRLLGDGEQALGEALLAAALARWPQHPHLMYTLLSQLITTQPEGEAPDLNDWRPIILQLNEASHEARQEFITRFRQYLDLQTILRLQSHALGMQPQRPEALRELARSLFNAAPADGPALELALLAAEQGHHADPDHAETILLWARLLDHAQRSDEAKLILRQALARDTWPIEDRFHIGEMQHFLDLLMSP